MRALLIGLLLALLLLGGAAAWVLGQAVSGVPEVGPAAVLSSADLERGRRLYHQLGPGRLREGETRSLILGAQDLELGVNYLLNRTGQGRARVRIEHGRVVARVSLNLAGRYLNGQLGFAPEAGRLALTQVRVGRVSLPAALVRPLAAGLLSATPYSGELQALNGMIETAAIRDGRLHLTLAWNEETARAALDALGRQLSGVRPEQLDAYRDRLLQLASRRPAEDFAAVLGALFELARERSAAGDPVAENRALLIALAEEANGVRFGLTTRQRARLPGMRLAGRGDFVEHFTLSSGLTAVAGEDLADMAGLYKEVRDTREGSGFSFTDLAVDRAGTRFGLLATESAASARRVQALLAGTDDAALFLPSTRGLPEFLPEPVFLERYGGVGGTDYNRLLGEIERRLAALPLYRDAGRQ